jgi:hypothetical protein
LFVEFDCAIVTKKKIKICISCKNILVAQVSKIFESWLKLCQYFKNNVIYKMMTKEKGIKIWEENQIFFLKNI